MKQTPRRKAPTGQRGPRNLSTLIRSLPAQETLTPEQLSALFLRHLMDADAVTPTKPETLYDAKTKALVALANVTFAKAKDDTDLTTLDQLLATPPPNK